MSFFEKITGAFGKSKNESPREQHATRVEGREAKKQFENADTLPAKDLEEAWNAKMQSQAEDRARLDDVRKRMADLKVSQSMWQSAGSKEAYMREAEKSAAEWRERLEREKEIERTQLEQQRAKQVEELKSKSVITGIDLALQQEEERQAEERAKRQRLGLN
ncbi:MAG: hypothetical protein PHS79_01705 [Patescibacteria group bacterium]|nr:hypothetical protein [Patescibacteria group bacterium]